MNCPSESLRNSLNEGNVRQFCIARICEVGNLETDDINLRFISLTSQVGRASSFLTRSQVKRCCISFLRSITSKFSRCSVYSVKKSKQVAKKSDTTESSQVTQEISASIKNP